MTSPPTEAAVARPSFVPLRERLATFRPGLLLSVAVLVVAALACVSPGCWPRPPRRTPTRSPPCCRPAGSTGSARTSSAATCTPGWSTGPATRCCSASEPPRSECSWVC
ncbi:hypothetical protein V6574_28260 [Streptomyces sp. SM1P]